MYSGEIKKVKRKFRAAINRSIDSMIDQLIANEKFLSVQNNREINLSFANLDAKIFADVVECVADEIAVKDAVKTFKMAANPRVDFSIKE